MWTRVEKYISLVIIFINRGQDNNSDHQTAGFCFKWLWKKLRSRCLHLVCPALSACTGLIRPGLIISGLK